jgi:Ca2+-binding EF-hand superfamily protein
VKQIMFALSLAVISSPVFALQGQMPDLDAMFFKQFDRNQDGQVSKAEFMEPTEAQFTSMDRDGNGALDATEVKAFNADMMKRMQEMQRQMQQQGGQAPQGMPRR